MSSMNSGSVVLRAVLVCIFDVQISGQPAYLIMYPVLDFAVFLSMCTVSAFQFPLKFASQQSASELLVGSKIRPSDLVAICHQVYPYSEDGHFV